MINYPEINHPECNYQEINYPEIWYRGDTYIDLPKQDSISWCDQYTVFAVVRNMNANTPQCLWSFAENDTLTFAVLTDGIYSSTAGVLRSSMPRDFSNWCIYTYHSGIRADSTKLRTLRLGEQVVTPDSTSTDTLHAQIQLEEFAYFSGAIPQSVANAFQTYLALKYGITLDYAAYISSAGDTLWHPIADEKYYHRIVGVGTDTIHRWYGTISQTKEDAVLLLQADSLGQGEYMLLGDDDGALTWQMETEDTYCLQRSWCLHKHQQRPQHITLALRLHALSETADSLRLQVTNDNGNVLQYIVPDSIIGDSLCYFTLQNMDTIAHIQLFGTIQWNAPRRTANKPNTPVSSNGTDVRIDVYNNVITVDGFADNRLFDVYLYDSTGKRLSTISSTNPISIDNVPTHIYHIEIFSMGEIVGSVTIPLQNN